MVARLTNEEFVLRCKKVNIIPLESYCGNNSTKVNFQCFCGNIFKTSSAKIFKRHTRSCGCLRGKRKNDNLPKILETLKMRGIELLSPFTQRKKNHLFKCHCGDIFTTKLMLVLSGDTKSCGCIKRNKTGYKEIPGFYWGRIQRTAKRSDKEFNVTIKYIHSIFVEQNKKCALSGVDIEFNSNQKHTTASLDRIDSSKGYIEGNVQWIHKELQPMKGTMVDSKFISWCTKVSNHQNICRA